MTGDNIQLLIIYTNMPTTTTETEDQNYNCPLYIIRYLIKNIF